VVSVGLNGRERRARSRRASSVAKKIKMEGGKSHFKMFSMTGLMKGTMKQIYVPFKEEMVAAREENGGG
jgi:hypothetical protein